MINALVVKTYGDTDMADAMAGAIIENATKRVIQLDKDELATVKAEVARLRDINGLRRYGDRKRLKTARREMAKKYSTKPVGRATGAFLGAYGLVCLLVATCYDRLAAMNRG